MEAPPGNEVGQDVANHQRLPSVQEQYSLHGLLEPLVGVAVVSFLGDRFSVNLQSI